MSNPKPPGHLSSESAGLWLAVTGRFRLPAQHDRLLMLACEALDRCAQAREAIAQDGPFTENRYGSVVAHPAVALERDSRLAFARLLRDMHLPEWPTAMERDEFDRFLAELG